MGRLSEREQLTVAEELNAYMTRRASREGMEWGLSSDWFVEHMRMGYCFFFGVIYTSAGIYADTQEPCDGFLDQFLAARGADLAARQAAVAAKSW